MITAEEKTMTPESLFKDVEVSKAVSNVDIGHLIPEKMPHYVPNPALDPIIEFYLDVGVNVGILGPAASGKTEGIIAYCAKHKRPLLQQSAAADLTSADVRGAVMLQGDQTRWIDGPLVTAMRVGGVYLLDEITAADSAVLSTLFSVGDARRTLYIAETGEVVRANAEFRLIACGNVEGAHVRQSLSDAFRSRFQVIISNDRHAMKVTAGKFSKVTGTSVELLKELIKEIRMAGGQCDARDLHRATQYYEYGRGAKRKEDKIGPGECLLRALQGSHDDSEIRASVDKSIIARFGDDGGSKGGKK